MKYLLRLNENPFGWLLVGVVAFVVVYFGFLFFSGMNY